MEREAWLELGEHRRRGAGGEGRPVRSRGEPRLRGELGGAQSRGLTWAAAAGRGVAAAGRWPRGGRGAGTASAERDRGQQVRPAFLQSPDEKETETEEERGRPGPAGAEPGPGPGTRGSRPRFRAPSRTSSGGRTGCASQLACPRCRGTETAVGKQVSFWQPAQCRGLGTLSPALGLLLLKLVPSVSGTRRPRSAPWG